MSKTKRVRLTKAKCKRCGYEWVPRISKPVVCANKDCRTPYWNEEYRTERRGNKEGE